MSDVMSNESFDNSVHDDQVDDAQLRLLIENIAEEFNKMKDMLNKVIINNRILKKRLDKLASLNEGLEDNMYTAEVNINGLDQYSRRENVEIRNIPENIRQRQLEDYVLEMIAKVGVHLRPINIVAVHRLGKFKRGGNRNVIVRFVNRKHAIMCLKNCRQLKDIEEYKSIFFTENLSPANKKTFNYLYKLKKNGKIGRVWTYNGEVFYKESNHDDAIWYKVDHIQDVLEFYEDNRENELSHPHSESDT